MVIYTHFNLCMPLPFSITTVCIKFFTLKKKIKQRNKETEINTKVSILKTSILYESFTKSST